MLVPISRCFAIHLVLMIVGCSTQGTPANPPAPGALSIEEWKSLPIQEKYDEATFERLRLNDASLKSDKAWRAFMIKVVIPERKVDIPTPPGTLPPGISKD